MKGGALTYRPRIDGLRFIAIGLVFLEHFGYRPKWFIAGYYGVDLFFVISGFLITSILLKDNKSSFLQNYRTFMGRRILRIFPIYYLTVALFWAINLSPARDHILWLVTYTYNYAWIIYEDTTKINYLGYLWSLSVEEQFYFLWPIIALTLRRSKLVLFSVTAIVVAVSYAQLAYDIVPAMTRFNYTGLFNRMGSLGFGALGAIYVSWKSLPARFFCSRMTEIAVLLVLAVALVCSFRLRFVMLGMCSLFLVLKASQFQFQVRPIDWLLQHHWVVYVGSISYGLYLFHQPLGHFITKYLFDPMWRSIPFEQFGVFAKFRWHSWIVKFPLYSLASVAVAWASYRWIESPILSLKDRWFGYRNYRKGS